jgi:hypothetical protein
MFIKFPHVERIGSDEIEGILEGTCYVFPKIDGTNSSVWEECDDTGACELKCGSHRRVLSRGDDNAGFCAYVHKFPEPFISLFVEKPHWTVYLEWLVPHTLKTYRDDAWRKAYVFDVLDRDTGRFVPYDEYYPLLDSLGFDLIPLMATVTNPTEEWLTAQLDKNTFLIEDGKGYGEGIVVKNYDFISRFGRTNWLKFVRNEFKERHVKEFGVPNVVMSGTMEQALAQEYVTAGRVDKVLEKMRETAPFNSRRIAELLSRVWNDIIVEEMWNILKDNKNPVIDFKRFQRSVITEIKLVKPDIF